MSEQSTATFSELIEAKVLEIGDGYRAKLEELGGDGPIFLRAGLLTSQGIEWDGGERFQSKAVAGIQSKLGFPGDIMVTTKGNSVGRAGYVPDGSPSFVYSPHLSYWRSRDPGRLSPGFLRYWVHSSEFKSQLRAMASSTDMAPYLSLSDQRRLRVSLPEIRVQEAIGSVLGALDDKIAVNNRIAETNQRLAQAYLAQWHEFAELTKLSEIANITMGSSPPGESYNEDGVGMPFYQGTRDFGDRFPGHRVWCTSPVRTAPEGSCLLSVRAPVGRVNIAREPCCIGRGVAAVQSKQDAPSVLFHELAAASDAWLPFESEGTVFGAINKQQLSDIELRVLDAKSAHALEEILRPLDQRMASAYDENQALASLRDTLLPKLMSGEIRVRDAEKVVEKVT